MGAKARHVDGRLLTADGRYWTCVNGWLEPDEAAALLAKGATWYVEWCGGGKPPPFSSADEFSPREVRLEVLGRVVTSERARRLRRKKTVPTVLVAEHWKDERDCDLVLFWESGPSPRQF